MCLTRYGCTTLIVMDLIEITANDLNLSDIYSKVVSPSCGAVSTFIGTTRDHFEGKKVVQLEYDGYVKMAEKQLTLICQQIRSKWKVENIAIVHRLGVVPIGDASVIIAISSEHRDASLQATSYAIEYLKATVPIWKKEIYQDTDAQPSWKENKECFWSH